MTAPDPPSVWWCARTGELATDYTAGMVYLDEHHRPPDDAVRLVPDEPRHEVTCPSCGATIRARMADAPAEGVAALLRRCDEIEPTGHGYGRIAVAEVRALLGGADNREGER